MARGTIGTRETSQTAMGFAILVAIEAELDRQHISHHRIPMLYGVSERAGIGVSVPYNAPQFGYCSHISIDCQEETVTATFKRQKTKPWSLRYDIADPNCITNIVAHIVEELG